MATPLYPGANVLLNITSTTTGAGATFQMMPDQRIGGIQSILIGTSAGVTVTSSHNIEVSNDGTQWNGLTGSTLAINGVTPQGAFVGLPSSLAGPWAFIRASFNTGSSTTTASTVYSNRVIAMIGEVV